MFVMEENLLCTPGIHHLAANRTTVARAFYGLGNAKLSRSVDCRSGIGGLANPVIRKIPTPFSQMEIAASRKG